MAFKRLREIRDRFEQQWINGGFIFGYENEINENHNNDYPLLVVLPPTSELPATEGGSKEDYTFECLIVKPYFQNHTGSLDVVLSLLEQEALTWLQRVLDSYTNKEVILSPDSISVEREKELYNDKLIQVRLTFTLNAFSHHFSHYDEVSISDLSPRVWLRSDLGVKTQMFGGNEVVKKWIDQSGNGNHFEQTKSSKMPSYEYKLSDNNYPYFSFDGTDDFMKCVNNGINSGTGIAEDHTIFWVAMTDGDAAGYLLSKQNGLPIPNFIIESVQGGYKVTNEDSGNDSTSVEDDTNASSTLAVYAIKFHNKTAKLFRNGTQIDSDTHPQFDQFGTYGVARALHLGSDDLGANKFFTGFVQEIIIFNDDHNEDNIRVTTDYLKHKYNI